MNATRQLGLYKELLWWLVSILITAIAIFPLVGKLYVIYYRFVALTCLLFITYFRFNIFFNSISYLRPKWVRKVILAVNPLVFVIVFYQMQIYFSMLDNYDITRFLEHPSSIAGAANLYDEFSYFKKVLILSSVGTLVMSAFFELRVLRGIFLQAPKGREKVLFKKRER